MVCTVQTDGLFTPYRPSVLKESMHSFFPFPFGLCFRTGFLLRDTVRSGRIFLRLFSFQPFQLPLVPKEQFIPFVEILLEDDAYTLSGEVGLGVIAVVGFVISFQTDIAGTVYEPFGLEVTYEVGVRHRILAIAEVTVYEQAVIQQLPGKHCLELHVRPAFFSGTEVCAEVPVIAVDNLRECIVQLSGKGRREHARHHVGVAGGVYILRSIELADT